MTEYLLLKWGSIKGRNVGPENEKAMEALKRYHDAPVSMSAVMQRDTPEQKQAVLDLIDAIDGEITNDWDGKTYTKDEAKQYVAEYHAA